MSRANNILILGPLRGDSVLLKSILLETKDYDVTLATDGITAADLVKTQSWNLLVINETHVTEKTALAIEAIRKINANLAVLTVTQDIESQEYQSICGLTNSAVIMRPFFEPELLTTVRKMIAGEEIIKRRYPRFRTNHFISVEIEEQNLVVGSQMQNFSSCGAFLHSSQTYFTVGDRIYIEVKTMSDQSHRIPATVRWVKRYGPWQSGQGVGVEFSIPSSIRPQSDLRI